MLYMYVRHHLMKHSCTIWPRQGDLEKIKGHPSVSPLMDRDKGGITKSQPGVRLYSQYSSKVSLTGIFHEDDTYINIQVSGPL